MCKVIVIFIQWFSVVGVHDAYEALQKLRTESFDLVISDVQMPGMDGFQLLEQIKKEFKLPVICESMLYIIFYVSSYSL